MIWFVQDFDSFPSQRDFFVGNNKYLQDMMFFLDGNQKRLRLLFYEVHLNLTPLFNHYLSSTTHPYSF